MGEINAAEFPSVLRDFMAYKSVIQGCSVKTVEEYMLDLRTFFRFLIASREGLALSGEAFEKIDIRAVDLALAESVTAEDIYSFLMFAGTTRGNQSAAKARKLSALKAFYKYLVSKKHYFEQDPTANIESPKKRQALPKFLTLEESLTLLETVKSDRESTTKTRDYAIITLFLNCGMRVSELVGINLSDLDRELRSVRVIGKGNKERVVYLNDACKEALAAYVRERLSESDSEIKTDALFLSSRNQRISVKTVQWMVYKYLDLAGLGSRHFSVHKLRHTAATLMYQSGNVDVRVLKDILGHEQLNTTQIYTHVSNRNMEQAMSENPLSKVGKDKPKS